MPFCSRCRAEYVPGIVTCADCGLPLEETPRAKPPVGEPVEEVAVARYPSESQAAMWAELLRNAGIPCRSVAYLTDLGAYWANEVAPHELRVRSSDAARARDLLGVERT